MVSVGHCFYPTAMHIRAWSHSAKEANFACSSDYNFLCLPYSVLTLGSIPGCIAYLIY